MRGNLWKKMLIVKGLLILTAIFFYPVISSADIYRKPLPSLPTTLDPKLYVDAYSTLISSQIYDRLFEFDEVQNIKPSLAEKWEVSDGGKIWIIHLKSGIVFHNGKPLTADDVAFSLKRLLLKDSVRSKDLSIIMGANDYQNGRSKDVSGIKVLSPTTVKIELSTPFPPFLTMLTATNTEIIPNNYDGQTETNFFRHPIGTGAFKFESMDLNRNVILFQNEKYFGGKPFLEKIIFEKSGKKAAVEGFNRGYYHDLEWYFDVDPTQITIPYTVIKSPAPDVSFIAFNLRRPPLNNVHVRKAIAFAIDKKKLIEECFPDRKAATGYIPPGVGGYDPNLQSTQFDLNKAQQEIKISGLSKENISKSIVLLRPDNHACPEKFKVFIESSLKKIGLDVTVKHLPLGVIAVQHYDVKNFDMFNMIFSSDYPEALFLLNYFRGDRLDNYSGFKSKMFDDLLISASKSGDRYERYNLYRKAQEILNQEAVVIPLFYDIYQGIYQRNIRGIEMPPYSTSYTPMRGVFFEK